MVHTVLLVQSRHMWHHWTVRQSLTRLATYSLISSHTRNTSQLNIFTNKLPVNYLEEIWLHVWQRDVEDEVKFSLVWNLWHVLMSTHRFNDVQHLLRQNFTQFLTKHLPLCTTHVTLLTTTTKTAQYHHLTPHNQTTQTAYTLYHHDSHLNNISNLCTLQKYIMFMITAAEFSYLNIIYLLQP